MPFAPVEPCCAVLAYAGPGSFEIGVACCAAGLYQRLCGACPWLSPFWTGGADGRRRSVAVPAAVRCEQSDSLHAYLTCLSLAMKFWGGQSYPPPGPLLDLMARQLGRNRYLAHAACEMYVLERLDYALFSLEHNVFAGIPRWDALPAAPYDIIYGHLGESDLARLGEARAVARRVTAMRGTAGTARGTREVVTVVTAQAVTAKRAWVRPTA